MSWHDLELMARGGTMALLALLCDPARLAAMSAGARSAALPDATVELADMVEAVA